MKGWIRLTNDRGRQLYIQVCHISTITENAQGGAVMAFAGDDDDYVRVQQTPQEVVNFVLPAND